MLGVQLSVVTRLIEFIYFVDFLASFVLLIDIPVLEEESDSLNHSYLAMSWLQLWRRGITGHLRNYVQLVGESS